MKYQEKNQKKGVADNAMDKIVQGAVSQKPRWYFVIRNSILWLSGGIFVAMSSIFVSVVIFAVRNDWHTDNLLKSVITRESLILIPSIWIISFVIFIAVGEWILSQTRRAYRFTVWQLTFFLGFISICIGIGLYSFGVAYHAERSLAKHIPFYSSMEERRNILFNRPEQGRVRGYIDDVHRDFVSIKSGGYSQEWRIDVKHLPTQKKSSLREGVDVVFFGRVDQDMLFIACDSVILPRRGIGKRLKVLSLDDRSSHNKRGQKHRLERLSPTCATIMDDDIYTAMMRHFSAKR